MIYRSVAALLFVAATSAVCQTAESRLSREELLSMSVAYAKLNGQTFSLHGNPELGKTYLESQESVSVIRKDLLGLVRKAITKSLSAPGATESQIRGAISAVQGDFSFDAWGGSLTNTPFARSFSLGGYSCFATAYAILEGGEGIPDSQSFLDFYVRKNDEWKLQAVTGSDFRSSKFFVAEIPAGLAGESWFLAWGQHIGNTRGKLSIRLYAFDGDNVRTVWKRDDLAYGEIRISGTAVALDYWTDPNNYRTQTHEVLHVTPNGLQ
jgi:hypothetical protein